MATFSGYLRAYPYYGYSNELYHHGIMGQKWGVRRYQNPDGTLTPEGKERYGDRLGDTNKSNKGILRRAMTGDIPVGLLGHKRIADRLEDYSNKKAKQLSDRGDTKTAEAFKKYSQAQKEANVNRDVYLSNTSTKKIFAQNLIFGAGADLYRNVRSRGGSRKMAAAEGFIGAISPVLGYSAELLNTKHKYGAPTI